MPMRGLSTIPWLGVCHIVHLKLSEHITSIIAMVAYLYKLTA
jgi:hypothetical protein